MHRLAPTCLVTALLTGAIACGPGGDDDAGECSDNILTGDLVITEVMANPAGEDRGSEWFEIYNASSVALDLGGLRLTYSLPDGSSPKSHVMDELVIEPGHYLVVGGVAPELKPSYVEYGYSNDLGSMRNGGARLTLNCGDTEIDTAEYPNVEASSNDGVAFGIDGNVAPNYQNNDSVDTFCPATAMFAPESFGSPGESNEPCDLVVPGMCTDSGSDRAVNSPAVGDLIITELMADADGADSGKEWFEVYAATDVDLNGVVVGFEPGSPKLSIVSSSCVTASAGSYFLFAGSEDEQLNAGLPPVDHAFAFTLKNGTTTTGPGSLYVGIGDTVLDQITWEDSESGVSYALQPDMIDPATNDNADDWLLCDAPYGSESNKGTPGDSNELCDLSGMCKEGDTFRPTVAPNSDQIMITEALANPFGDEGNREWFEVTALGSFDLNGVQLGEGDGSALTHTFSQVDCVPMTSGDSVVFAGSTVDGDNDSLTSTVPAGRLFELPFASLTNTGETLVVGFGDAIFHTFDYGNNNSEGQSRQLDPDGVTICHTPETTPYGAGTTCGGGDGNCGTPGAVNPDCL